MPPNTEPHNDRCASLLGQGCDCRSPWPDEPPDTAATMPTYSEVMTSLDGCSEALSRLIDAVRGLFDSAGTQTGYDEAVTELHAAHNAAVDWCAEEAKRHA